MGVVMHGNKRWRNLPESQVQSDLIHLFRSNLTAVKCEVSYSHIYGHLDDNTEFQNLSLPQQLNVIADTEAKRALRESVDRHIVAGPHYPLEPVTVMVKGRKVTSSTKQALYTSWGADTARALFQRRRIVSTHHFYSIAWNYVRCAMSKYPPSYCTWVTKQASGFNATNYQQARIDGRADATCPCCGHNSETTGHITRCPNPGRRKLFHKTVDNLLDWMESTHSDLPLVECLEEYLLSHGEGSMQNIAGHYPHLHQWAEEHDILGWDNFLEGRVGHTIFRLQRKSLSDAQSRMHIKTWATLFIQHVLTITHQQWAFRNARVHIRLLEGKTAAEHRDIMEEVLDRIATPEDDLLPQHRHLIDVDFARLGEGTTADRQYWIANLDSAVKAATQRGRMLDEEVGGMAVGHNNEVTAVDDT
jgi:hypothetical protein